MRLRISFVQALLTDSTTPGNKLMARKFKVRTTEAAAVDSYKHMDKRKRIPTQEESEKLSARDKQPAKKRYDYDPSLDPQLVWAGKKETGAELAVSTVPIYVQEKIAPEAIIARLKQGAKEEAQLTLFGETTQQQFDRAVEFYKHEDNWQNRMILGDSLLVMNSLLEKEGMRGKVQCVYIDPPYGIKFGSNWQTSTRKRDVRDNKVEDFVRQPEQVKAFRDTWELGIHSYLSYLRDRLIVARELLTESGSCFVQISDENVHHVREVMEEVFGSENFVSQVIFRTTSGFEADTLSRIGDYLIWYAKDIKGIKYRQVYEPQYLSPGQGGYNWLLMPDGSQRGITAKERADNSLIPKGAIIYKAGNIKSQGASSTPQDFIYEGKKYNPGTSHHWKTTVAGLNRLKELKRIHVASNSIQFRRFLTDFPYKQRTTVWDDTGTGSFLDDKIFVVQTSTKVIERCLQMITDPGDLVLDPTCGSGTTAYVSEELGRRWITVDTSRVALALARTRLMTSKFPYYSLKEANNVRLGFEYKTVPHVTLKSLANNEKPEQEVLCDEPIEDKQKIRVTGPFTVESLSPHRVSDAQEMITSERFVETIVSNLLKAGVQTGEKGARVEFANLDILPGGPEIQASGEYKTKDGLKKVAVAIGPEFGSVDDDFIRDAARVAKRFADLLIVAATSFEASAFTEASEISGLRVMKVKINPDLSMGDLLKKTGSANLFMAFGEPEVKVKETKEGFVVEIVGVDIYDPVKGEIRSSGSGDPEHDIAAWFIDINYNGEAFFVTHAYFLGADKPYEKLKKVLKADISESAWDDLYSTVSRPFARPKTGKIAVKVINHYGDEVMKVITL